MAFKTKTDLFKLSTVAPALQIASEDQNRASEFVDRSNDAGDVVESNAFGDTSDPSCGYEVAGNIPPETKIKFGEIIVFGDRKTILTKLTISTAAGQAPTVNASGGDIGTSTGEGVKPYVLENIGLTAQHVAQILFGWGKITGEGAHLTTANYTASATPSWGTLDGKRISFGVSKGMIEATLTISANAAEPELELAEGWKIKSALTCQNPKDDFPTYSATIVKYLARAAE